MAVPASGGDAPQNPQARHDAAAHQFTVSVDGVDANLDYHNEGKVMVITHTTVPSQIGGRGIAGQLVKAAFEHAREQEWQVRPECSYAEVWAKRHPEYLPLLA